MDTTTPLARLLDQQLALPPEYRNGLSSHLPMALHALHALGATPARLQAFSERYARRFAGAPAAPPAAPVHDWLPLRGRFDAFASLQATFAESISRHGRHQTLQAALPALLPGVAAAAFHGAIRTAHAWQSEHGGELAAALADWAARWQPTPPAEPRPATLNAGAWLAALAGAGQPAPGGPLISTRMRHAESTAAYRTLAAGLCEGPEALPQLSRWAARRYAETRDFTVLHLVTGCRALRVLWQGLDDAHAAAAWPHAVRAFASAYLSCGAGERVVHAPTARPGWPAIIAAAIASDDDHVIKLVHACVENHALDPHPAYEQAAAAAVA